MVRYFTELVGQYNFTDKHRTIGMATAKVNNSNENVVLDTIFKQPNKKSKVKFQVSDRVRITSFKYPFNNKYDSNWTWEKLI